MSAPIAIVEIYEDDGCVSCLIKDETGRQVWREWFDDPPDDAARGAIRSACEKYGAPFPFPED